MLSFFKNKSPEDWKCLDGKATRQVDNDVACLTVNKTDCMANACINDKLISPLPTEYGLLNCLSDPKKWCNPLKDVKVKINDFKQPVLFTSDYIYYLIDIIVSIIAITLALMTTKDNYNQRIIHVIAAIMFRYVYIGYFLINNGLSLALFK